MRNLYILFIMIFYGCSARGGITTNDLLLVRYGSTADEINKITKNNYIYRLEFIAENNFYIYQTFTDIDTSRYYGFLFKNNILINVIDLNNRNSQWPKIKDCTRFPNFHEHVNDCLVKNKNLLLKWKIELQPEYLNVSNTDEQERITNENLGGATMVSLYSILASEFLIPIAVITAPIIISYDADDASKLIKFKLGDDIKYLKEFIRALPDKAKSFSNGNGSFYIPIGSNDSPEIGVGVYKNKIIWIQPNVESTCKIKNIFGPYYKCKIGY